MKTVLAVAISVFALPAGADCTRLEAYQGATPAGITADCDTEPGACRWSFALGDPTSRALFENMRMQLDACPGRIGIEQDKGVNHPDFYDAWIFEFGDTALSVSLKDKAALKKTFVVVRSLPRP